MFYICIHLIKKIKINKYIYKCVCVNGFFTFKPLNLGAKLLTKKWPSFVNSLIITLDSFR